MPKMQTADILVSLGGDTRNTVPKYEVTAAEIVVLLTIHGDDAVHDIKPRGFVDRSTRDEMDRLHAAYGAAKDSEGKRLIDQVYPGRAPVLHMDLSSLELEDAHYAATARETPEAKAKAKPRAKGKAKAEDVDAADAELAEESVLG